MYFFFTRYEIVGFFFFFTKSILISDIFRLSTLTYIFLFLSFYLTSFSTISTFIITFFFTLILLEGFPSDLSSFCFDNTILFTRILLSPLIYIFIMLANLIIILKVINLNTLNTLVVSFHAFFIIKNQLFIMFCCFTTDFSNTFIKKLFSSLSLSWTCFPKMTFFSVHNIFEKTKYFPWLHLVRHPYCLIFSLNHHLLFFSFHIFRKAPIHLMAALVTCSLVLADSYSNSSFSSTFIHILDIRFHCFILWHYLFMVAYLISHFLKLSCHIVQLSIHLPDFYIYMFTSSLSTVSVLILSCFLNLTSVLNCTPFLNIHTPFF